MHHACMHGCTMHAPCMHHACTMHALCHYACAHSLTHPPIHPLTHSRHLVLAHFQERGEGEALTGASYLQVRPKGEGERVRHYTCRALPSLDIGGLAAVLLAFAQECAPAQDASGRPLSCVVEAGPFDGAGLGAEGGEGSDVEPRMAKALVASNFARGTGPPLRVYRVP